jgi:hypothetical protein
MSGQVDYEQKAGRCAYEAYRREAWERAAAEPLPKWDDLTPNVQKAWVAVVDAVGEHDNERTTPL